jgi:hypothetical protein
MELSQETVRQRSYYARTAVNYPEQQCRSVHIMNTTPAGSNLYRTASHPAVLGLKASR